MKTLFFVLLSLSAAITQLRGETFVCQDGSNMPENSLFCQCRNGLFYNAVDGKCQDICQFYGNRICGYYNSAECVVDSLSQTGFSCQCPDGFYDAVDGFCVEKSCNETGVICLESNHEECLPVLGEDKCICIEGYLRNQDGVCREIDPCHQAFEYPCNQVCTSSEGSFECSCFDGYTYDPNTANCKLDDQYDYCTCSYPTNMAVCHEDDEGKQVCNPLPGYQFSNETSSEVVDTDECLGEYYCPANSLCRNEIGSYSCDCLEGYTYNSDSNECEAITCPDGTVLIGNYCRDICDYGLQTCKFGSQCMVNDKNIGICKCQLSCQMKDQASSPYNKIGIYAVNFYTPYYTIENSNDVYDIVKSFEILFGTGNAEQAMKTRVYAGVSKSVSPNFFEEQLRSMCFRLDAESFEPKCILPNGLIINENSLSVTNLNDPCYDLKSMTCRNISGSVCINFREDMSLMPGTYRCKCSKNYLQVQGLYDFYCEDYNECAQPSFSCPDGTVCVDGIGSPATCEDDNGQISSLNYDIVAVNNRIYSLESNIFYYQNELDDEEKIVIILGSVLGPAVFVTLVALAVIVYNIVILRVRR